jgi:hypothetical protein
MWEVITACVIMHIMIVQDERDHARLHYQGWQFQYEFADPQLWASWFEEFLHVHHELHDFHIHDRLQANLIEHH